MWQSSATAWKKGENILIKGDFSSNSCKNKNNCSFIFTPDFAFIYSELLWALIVTEWYKKKMQFRPEFSLQDNKEESVIS